MTEDENLQKLGQINFGTTIGKNCLIIHKYDFNPENRNKNTAVLDAARCRSFQPFHQHQWWSTSNGSVVGLTTYQQTKAGLGAKFTVQYFVRSTAEVDVLHL